MSDDVKAQRILCRHGVYQAFGCRHCRREKELEARIRELEAQLAQREPVQAGEYRAYGRAVRRQLAIGTKGFCTCHNEADARRIAAAMNGSGGRLCESCHEALDVYTRVENGAEPLHDHEAVKKELLANDEWVIDPHCTRRLMRKGKTFSEIMCFDVELAQSVAAAMNAPQRCPTCRCTKDEMQAVLDGMARKIAAAMNGETWRQQPKGDSK